MERELLHAIEEKIEDYHIASQRVWGGHWLSIYFARQRDKQIKKWEHLTHQHYTLRTNTQGFCRTDDGETVGTAKKHLFLPCDPYSLSRPQRNNNGGLNGH